MTYNPEEDKLLEHFEQEGRGTHVTLPISSILIDEDLQVRSSVDHDLVAKYAEEMNAGDVFPPIIVFYNEDKKNRAADGIHRLLAKQKNKQTSIDAIVYRGSKQDALRYAIKANRQHGRTLSNEDKHRAVLLLLKAYLGTHIGDNAIAKLVGVSQPFVSKIRREFETSESFVSYNRYKIEDKTPVISNTESDLLQTDESDDSAKVKQIRVVRNGREYWQKLKKEVPRKDKLSRDEWLAKTETSRPQKHDKIVEVAKSQQSPERLGPFTVLYADPPWQYNVKMSESKAIENHYPTLSLEDLCTLDVSSICAADAILFLWVTAPMVVDATALIRAWGFEYRTNITWHKTGAPGMGHWARINHEHLFICVRGSFPTPSHSKLDNSIWSLPRGRHSEKPREFREHIEELFPNHLKAELFARETALGWTSIGNEIDGRDIREVLGTKPKETI